MRRKVDYNTPKITHLRNVIAGIERQLKVAKELLIELESYEIDEFTATVDRCQREAVRETQPPLPDSATKETKKLSRKKRRQQGKAYGRAWYLEEQARQLKKKVNL